MYAQPNNMKEKIREAYDGGSDVGTDGVDPDLYIEPRPKECWVCGELDEWTDATYKVLC